MSVPSITRALSLLLLLLMAQGCEERAAFDKEIPRVIYTVVAAERVTLTNELPGRVSALVTSEVRPQVDGIIRERLFEEGADVAKGQILYRIDPAVYQAAYNTAAAALEEAEANVVALAMLEKRYTHLVKTRAVSHQELDNATADHGQARARIARAKAELEAAAINLAYTQIKAPVSGRIGRSSITPGALVTANQPEALAVIQQTDRVYVDITQSSADTIRLRRAMAQGRLRANGSAAKAHLILEDGTPYTLTTESETAPPKDLKWITGDLLFSEISVGQTTGSVSLRAVFENPEGLLLPGMYVKAIIEEGAVDGAVLIPQGSVVSNGSGGHYVLVLEKGDAPDDTTMLAARRDINLGRTVANRRMVNSGLAPGDLLVVEGLQKAISGEAVTAVPRQEAQPR